MLQDDFRFTVTSLGEYVREQPVDGLTTWCGELRSGARANVLMGVASNRVDVHQAAARAERSLERVAEPLSALFLPPAQYPAALLDVGWRQLILNSAHDSSCACSSDEVVEAVRVRYQEARHVGDALTRDALRQLATTIDAPPSSTIVVNSTARPRGGLVEVPLPGTGPVHLVAVDDGTACPTQVVRTIEGEGVSTVVVGQKIRWVLEMMRGPELAGARIARVEDRTLPDGSHEFTFHDAAPGETELDLEATKATLLALGEAGATIAIRQRRAPVREVVVAADRVPGFGWRTYRAVEGAGPGTAVRAEGHTLANEHLQVEVDPADGTVTIEADGLRWPGLNRYVDGGDGGDTYNYSPPEVDTVVDRPERVRVRVDEAGPVRARTVVTASYRWPAHAVGDERSCARRSDDARLVDVVTTLELRTGERFLRVHVALDHQVRDHRLRAHFPLLQPVDGSDAECAFAVVHRGLTAEGGPHEFGLPTFVSRRFVDAAAGGAGLGGAARRPPRVRGGRRRPRAGAHAAARHRLPLPLRAVVAPEPRRPVRPARGPAAPGPPRARLRGAPPPRRLGGRAVWRPPPTSSWCRSSGCVVAVGRAPTSRRPDGRSASTVPRSRHCIATTREPWSCGWSTSRRLRPRSRWRTPTAYRSRATWSTSPASRSGRSPGRRRCARGSS